MERTARSVPVAGASARRGWDRAACARGGNTAVNASSCPALLVAGCASGQGKTTVTAAMARYHSRAGRRVRVFKTGPDFIDPMVLEAASAAPVYNLDCWMVGIEASRALLAAAANEADLILVEGAMGLYDREPSTGIRTCAYAGQEPASGYRAHRGAIQNRKFFPGTPSGLGASR